MQVRDVEYKDAHICKLFKNAECSARILLFCKYSSAIVIRNQVLAIIIIYIVSLPIILQIIGYFWH